MRKLLMLVAVIAVSISTVSAQTATKTQKKSTLTTYEKGRNAIGIRVGNGIELNYQKYIKDANRLEVGVGYNFEYGFDIAGIYQWLWPISVGDVGFNWYAGVGANIGVWYDKFGFGALGQAGIEYNFKIPLALSVDWRPSIHFLPGDMHFGWEGFALGLRYRF